MKLILHIGLPKTGTTSIQNFLEVNRMELGRQGTYVTDVSLTRNHVEFATLFDENFGGGRRFFGIMGIRDRKSASKWRAKFDEAVQGDIDCATSIGAKCYVVSSEFFSLGLNEKSLRDFKIWAEKRFSSIEVVVVLRFQPDLIESFYTQRLRNGLTKSLDSYANSIDSDDPTYNFEKLLRLFESLFGRESIRVLFFPRNRVFDSVSLFIDYLGVRSSRESKGEATRANEGLSILGQKLLLRVNQIYGYERTIWKDAISKRSVLQRRIAERFKGRGERLSALQIERVSERFKGSNEYVVSTYSNHLSVEDAFGDQPKDDALETPIVPAPVLREEWGSLHARIWLEFPRRLWLLAVTFIYVLSARSLSVRQVKSLKQIGFKLLEIAGIRLPMR